MHHRQERINIPPKIPHQNLRPSSSSPSAGPQLTTTAAPLPQTISQRLERKLHNFDVQKDMKQWTDATPPLSPYSLCFSRSNKSLSSPTPSSTHAISLSKSVSALNFPTSSLRIVQILPLGLKSSVLALRLVNLHLSKL